MKTSKEYRQQFLDSFEKTWPQVVKAVEQVMEKRVAQHYIVFYLDTKPYHDHSIPGLRDWLKLHGFRVNDEWCNGIEWMLAYEN